MKLFNAKKTVKGATTVLKEQLRCSVKYMSKYFQKYTGKHIWWNPYLLVMLDRMLF